MRDNIYNIMKEMTKKGKVLVFSITMVLSLSSVLFAQNYMSTNAGCENNLIGAGGGKVYNQNGIAPGNEIPVGCVVQYIYAGTDNSINPPAPSGATTGDDILITTQTVGNDTVYLAFSNIPGVFYHNASRTYTSGTPKIYIRVWNNASIPLATYYGNSALFSPNLSIGFPTPNDVGISNMVVAAYAGPIISIISPSSGINTASTSIKITGNRYAGVTSVKIGTFDVASYTVSSSTTIDAVIPAGLPVGVYDMKIITGSGSTETTIADQFTVTAQPAPAVTLVNPSIGSNSGTTAIRITGTDLNGAITVKVGTFDVSSFTVISSTTIDAVIPAALPAGVYNITVTTGIGTSSIVTADQFTVTSPSSLPQVAPDTVPPVISGITADNKAILANDIINSVPALQMCITDDSSAIDTTSISVTIGSKTYTTTSSPAIVYTASTPLSGIITLTPDTIASGNVSMLITAKDTAGNSTSQTLNLNVATGTNTIAGSAFNYPNPFNPLTQTTKIAFNMNSDRTVAIYLFDTTGRIIAKIDYAAKIGYNEAEWNGHEDFGSIAANGIYLVRIVSEGKLIGKTKIWVIKR